MPAKESPTPPRVLIDLTDAAAALHCSQRTIRRRIASGELTGYRFGKRLIRIDAAELDTLLRPIPNAVSA